jgi:1,2-diacylglycerol 3-alpha-glucosyltransferase
MTNKTMKPKIALVCSGLGNQNRGLESFFENLYNNLKEKIDLTLLKGGGVSEGSQLKLFNIKRDSVLLGGKNSPISWGRRYKFEQLTFSIPMLLHIISNNYDIIQVSDPDLARYLDSFKNFFRNKYRIIFTNAFPKDPAFYQKRFDLIQQVSKFYLDEALIYGVEEKRMTLIPYAVDTERFAPSIEAEKAALREKFGIPKDSFVVISAGSIDKNMKRMDYLIREVSLLPDKVFLLIVGQEGQESAEIKNFGSKKLRGRIRFATYKNEEMPQVYKAADAFTLCSLKEGFGLVFIEAMASGLPIIAHHHQNMKWIIADCGKTIDLSIDANLAKTISELINNRKLAEELGRKSHERAVINFSWKNQVPNYINMYNSLFKV